MTKPSSYSLLPAYVLKLLLPFQSPVNPAFCVLDLNTFILRDTEDSLRGVQETGLNGIIIRL
jgi:hypothetical protein